MKNFIEIDFIRESICDELIDFFKSRPDKFSAHFRRGEQDCQIDESVKSGLEIAINPFSIELKEYLIDLQKCLNNYIKKYPYSNGYSAFTIKENIKIQYYKPGQGFLKFHTERGGPYEPISARHLVFMTYLNTIEDGGGTEFYHQNYITSAEKGKTVIWPADWTHTHRGIISKNEEKYIITGWYSFV